MAVVKEITDETIADAVFGHRRPVLLLAHAAGCEDSKGALIIFERISEENQGDILFAKIDTDVNRKAHKRFEVKRYPTIVLLHHGALVYKQIAETYQEEILQWFLIKAKRLV